MNCVVLYSRNAGSTPACSESSSEMIFRTSGGIDGFHSDHAHRARTSERELKEVFTVEHVIDLAWGRLEKEPGGRFDAFCGVHVKPDRGRGGRWR